MVFTTPDLSDDYPEAKALSPILTNFGGRKSFFGPIETLQCPDDNSFVKKLLNSKGDGKILVVDAGGINTVALLGDMIAEAGFSSQRRLTIKKLTLLIAMLIAIGGCSKEVPSDQLVERGGLKYEVNSQTPFTGTVVDYHDNGQLEWRTHFKDGKLHGLAEAYDEDGNPTTIDVWKDGKPLKGTFYAYYENGQLRVKGNYKDGEFDGLLEECYENGQLFYKTNYKDGEFDGLHERYYKNGQLWNKENFKDGNLIFIF